MELQVFAEGFDIKFLNDYISFLNLPISRLICNKTEGWTNLPFVASKFQEASNKQVKNIVIFDANGNFQERRNKIFELANLHQIEFELFLFPDNNSSGCFEDLLLKLVRNKMQFILNCFNTYCQCINNNNLNFNMPLKSKVFAYLEATQQPLKIEKVNFSNNEFWNLNHEELIPLKSFIEQIAI
jgi:hypothetical protein